MCELFTKDHYEDERTQKKHYSIKTYTPTQHAELQIIIIRPSESCHLCLVVMFVFSWSLYQYIVILYGKECVVIVTWLRAVFVSDPLHKQNTTSKYDR